jgi:hypothetical protein
MKPAIRRALSAAWAGHLLWDLQNYFARATTVCAEAPPLAVAEGREVTAAPVKARAWERTETGANATTFLTQHEYAYEYE